MRANFRFSRKKSRKLLASKDANSSQQVHTIGYQRGSVRFLEDFIIGSGFRGRPVLKVLSTPRRLIYMVNLTSNQWNLVYNVFSFGLVSMLACTIYTLVSQQRVLAKYRNALVMSSMVTFIAGYHYLRIFNSFNESSADMTVNISGAQGSFNEAYRYVDWLLTVPLLLVEVIAVLALAKEVSRSLIMRLVPASAAMIALGYPGEISNDQNTQVLYGVLSTIPFLYILYVLFVELGKSLDRQPEGVAATIGRLRLLLVATWGVYPISYILGMGGDATAEQFVGVQVGYTIADVLAKCVFGLTILKIARMKSMAEGMKDDH